MTITAQQMLGAIKMIDAIRESIQDFGECGVPSGHLYAMVLGVLSLEQYQQVIGILKDAGRIKEENHVLYHVK